MTDAFHVEVSREEIIWAAGLFEGEGSIALRGDRPCRLQVKMTTEVSVRRFADAVGTGTGRVYGPYGPHKAQPNRTPYFIWVGEYEDATAVANLLVDYVSEPWRCRLMHVIARDSRRRRPRGYGHDPRDQVAHAAV